MDKATVVVVGAGPAGSAATVALARADVDVVVIDKATFPRDKCCGDGLTAGALRHLEHLGLDPDTVKTWKPVTDVRITRPSGASMVFPLPTGPGQFAATAAREDLDAALVDCADSAGATIREGVALDDVELFDNRVVVHTSEASIEADWCIAADGMWSPTRKALGLSTAQPYLGEWHAFRQYWRHVSPRAAEQLFVWFEPDILPGYMWCFPLPDDRANVGFGVLRGTRKTNEMGDLWQDLLARPHIREILGPHAEPEAAHKAWPIPARVGELPMTAHRTFFVGDATGACDPMTGEGIGQALQTGLAAADAVIAATSPADAARRYTTAVQKELAVDMRFAATLGNVLGTRLGAEWSLATAGMTNWSSRNFARWLFEDYPRALLGTPRRWRRDMFSLPGAYSAQS